MLDASTIAALAASAVAILGPLLQKAAEKGAEEIGKSSIGALFDKLKGRLKHDGAKDALADLTMAPADAAAKGAVEMQLRKALAADPGLAAFVQGWIAEAKAAHPSVALSANVQGDHNTVTQIAGSGNSVG